MAFDSCSPSRTEASAFLRAAHDIGHVLCRDALWWEGRCNWSTDDIATIDDRPSLVHATCGGDLYSGTAGIGLFLAALAWRTGDRIVARTARGALAHALAWHERQASRPSLFSGSAGIGLAGVMAGDWLGDAELVAQGLGLLERSLRGAAAALPGADIMHGLGGSLLAGLAMRHRLDDTLLHVLVGLGDGLLAMAKRDGAAWCWPDEGEIVGMNGLSHGAAGIAVALAELAAASGETRFRDAVDRAIAYEQAWFDPLQGNWPDLFADTLPSATRPPPFSWSWCHGAPGIGLARLRLWRLCGDAAHRNQLQQALASTRRAVVRKLDGGDGNYSLCHGLAGNAELLLEAGRRLGDRDALALAERVGMQGIERYGDEARWPCGVDDGDAISPSLMLGWAGTGWLLLRLDDPGRIPSLLSLEFTPT